jgi:transcriptional regulator with XRE-family HTH domain
VDSQPLTFRSALDDVFRAAGTDVPAFISTMGLRDPDPYLGRKPEDSKEIGAAAAEQTFHYAALAARFLEERVPAAYRRLLLADLITEFQGAEETFGRNVGYKPVSSTRSGLGKFAPIYSLDDPLFASLTAMVAGDMVAYWAWMSGAEETRMVSHQSIELFANLDDVPIDLNYAADVELSRPRTTRVAPGHCVIFDGRAPHRHLSTEAGRQALALTVQLPQGPAYTDAVAFSPVDASVAMPERARHETALSFGMPVNQLDFARMVGRRLRAFRAGYDRTLDDVARLLKWREEMGSTRRVTTPGKLPLSGSDRVRLSRIESGLEKLPFQRLLYLADALDVSVRELVLYPQDVILLEPQPLLDDAFRELDDTYFFSGGPAGVFDIRVVPASEIESKPRFRRIPGECLVVPFNCTAKLHVAVRPAMYTLSGSEEGNVRTTIARDRSQKTLETMEGRAVYFRGDLPHRLEVQGAKGKVLLVGHKRLLDAWVRPRRPRRAK